MGKRIMVITMTVIGIIIIIMASVILKFQYNIEKKNIEIAKSELLSNAKKCIEDEICSKENILITTLIENGYVSEKNKELLENYSKDSFISYPYKTVYLIDLKG